MITIVFESHATSFDNEAGIASGHYDVELSDLGKQQAMELGQRYKNENFDAIFCPDLKRAFHTAQIAFNDRCFAIIQNPRLRECDYGDLTRHPKKEVDKLKLQHITIPFPRGESYMQCAKKMRSFLQDLLKSYQNKKIMIIGARATQYGLEHLINGVPLRKAVTAPWQWQPGWTYYLKDL